MTLEVLGMKGGSTLQASYRRPKTVWQSRTSSSFECASQNWKRFAPVPTLLALTCSFSDLMLDICWAIALVAFSAESRRISATRVKNTRVPHSQRFSATPHHKRAQLPHKHFMVPSHQKGIAYVSWERG